MKMDIKMLKLLIVVCGLSLTMTTMAVNYNFSKDGSVSRVTPLQEFDVEQQSIQKITPQSSNSISTLTSGAAGSVLNFSSLGRTVSTTATLSDGGVVGTSAFSSQSTASLYESFDNQGVLMASTNGFNGPVKLPVDPDGTVINPDQPWTPVGDGLILLLLMAGFYVIKRCKK